MTSTSTKRHPNVGRRLQDRTDPAVIDALSRECPACQAPAGQRCAKLTLRLVHYARCRFRDIV